MSCLHCNAKYGFFNKEAGCGNCGISLCHKCLKHKYKVLATGKEAKICGSCYTKLSKEIKTDTEKRPPPDIFLKRLANLQSSKAGTASEINNPQELCKFTVGLSSADQQIAQRLEKLKGRDDRKALPSENEIRNRLDNLKGETARATIVYDPKAVDTRSDQEKIDSLLEQYASEINIREESTSDLEERITKLKGEKIIKEKQKLDNEDVEAIDEEVEAEKVTKNVMSQIALENKNGAKLKEKDDIVKFEEELEDEPELPWCVLCNANAQLRCLDCKDLYCTRCCREAHKEWGDDDHEIIKYKEK